MLATDVDFGPDGALYFSDWVEGLGQAEQRANLPSRWTSRGATIRGVARSKTLLAQGMERARRLMRWPGCWPTPTCGFARRLSSSWPAAVRRHGKRSPGSPGSKSGTLPRIHAVWGLEQAARDHSRRPRARACGLLWPRCSMIADPEVRAQAAKVLG